MLTVTLKDAATRAPDADPRQGELRCEPVEAMRRCRAAACVVIPYDAGGGTARQDAASEVLLSRMLEAQNETGGATTWPRRYRMGMAILQLECRGWYRAERKRVDGLTAELPSLVTAELAGRPAEAWTVALPHEEAMRGAERLATLLRLPYLTVHAALYTFLRGLQTDECAQAWGVSHDSFRQSVSRGKRAIRDAYPDPTDLLHVLSLLDSGGSEARTRTHMLAPEWRTLPTIDADVVSTHVEPSPVEVPADMAEYIYLTRQGEHHHPHARIARTHAGNGSVALR